MFFSSPHTGDFAPVKEMLKLVELVTLESHMDCLCRYLWLCSDAAALPARSSLGRQDRDSEFDDSGPPNP